MSTLPDYYPASERAYFAPELETSKAYDAAEATLINLKKAIADLMWISGNELEKTSYGVITRWRRLNELFTLIRREGDRYSPSMMKRLESQLEGTIKDAYRDNVDFDYDSPAQYFRWHLKDYAEVIIEALEKNMSDSEAQLFDNNR